MTFVTTIVKEINKMRQEGRNPKYLILCDSHFTRFYAEVYRQSIANETQPNSPLHGHRQFMGLTVVALAKSFGGTFLYALGE